MPNETPNSWKEKYLDTLDTLEQEQKAWTETEKTLRHALSRLSLAIETKDRALNAQLEDLRKTIRKDGRIAQIQGLMEEISASILRIDQQQREADTVGAALEKLEHSLEGVQLPSELRKSIRDLKRGLDAARKNGDLQQALETYSGVVAEVFAWMTEQPAATKAGLFGRLFSRKDDDEGQDEAGLVAREGAQPGSLAALPAFTQVLFDLINRLDLPEELKEQKQRISNKLNDQPSPELAESVIADIADLMAKARRQVEQEKNDLEEFLSQLTRRLQELDRHLGDSAGNREQATAQGSAIDASMSAEVAEIRRSVAEAQDFHGLKSSIQVHLENIQEHMDARRQLEREQLARAEAEVNHLRQELAQVENESQDLRQRLQDARERALRDALTGLYNRLAYDERIAQECDRWARYGRPAVLSIWDIDYFKRINDEFGHKAGDTVLRAVAKLLQESTRKSDFVARFGGEEFMLLFPETDMATALELANRLRERVAAKRYQYHGKPVPLTISCGLAEFAEGETPDEVYRRADEALYSAKAAGRNCCRTFQGEGNAD